MTDVDYPIEIEFDYLPTLNFVMQQNNVSLIRRFSIKNITDHTLHDIRISLLPEPAFFRMEPYRIDSIRPDETIRIEDLKLYPDAQLLVGLTESLSAVFQLEVDCVSEEDVLIRTCPLRILAYDQWGGSSILPEMLVSFVTPNYPAIAGILKKASSLLEEWTGNPSLDNYQTRDPNRVKQQMAALFHSIAAGEVVYTVAPAGFEKEGQRIRLVDAILGNKLGNCLEMTLLYVACLEATGIHPLIVVKEGHAFAGAWLVEETFPDNLTDDSTFLLKRTAEGINEILLVESTCMNKRDRYDFEEAVELATGLLNKEEEFIYALDIKRTRLSGIRPIPQRIKEGDNWVFKEDESFSQPVVVTRPYELTPIDFSAIDQEAQFTKQIFWERKLLDLSLRNNLLNLRITKNTLRLAAADLACFEDALADGKEFRILSVSDSRSLIMNPGDTTVSINDPHIKNILENELKQHRLRSLLPEEELKRALQHLYRSSRLSIEENGANTLYLALGFLKWFETPSSVKPRYAPILLLPVEMIRKSSAGGFVIRSREEDSLLNITLLEMLRQNFGITIPGLDPLPTDDSGVNVNLIYSIVRNSIKNQDKWNVEESAVLGIFSFNKFIMWNDLHNNSEKLTRNPVVFSLMNGMLEWQAEEMEADASVLDRELSPADILLPISADSSQLEAIYEAVGGKSFILHGPPGTGKSQTITNIIVNALYQGKRVLFVAEKMAALSVVQSRLAALGLDPFCLELHSNKTKKSAVMEQIKKTTEITRYKSPAQFAAEAGRLHSLRSELNTYIDVLHLPYPFGLSLYEAIVRYLALEKIEEIAFPAGFPATVTPEIWQEQEEAVNELVNVGNTFGHPHGHPLTGTQFPLYSSAFKEDVTRLLEKTIHNLLLVKEKMNWFSSLIGGEDSSYSKDQLELTGGLVSVLSNIPELTSVLLMKPSLHEVLEDYKEVVQQGRERDRLRKELKATFDSECLRVPANLWLNNWKTAAGKWFMPRYFGQQRVYKDLKKYSLSGKIEKEKVPVYLETIREAQEREKYVDEYRGDLTSCFGRMARANQEDWNRIEKSIKQTEELNSLILQYAFGMEQATRLKENLGRHLHEGIRSFQGMYEIPMRELLAVIKDFVDNNSRLDSLLGVDIKELYGAETNWPDHAHTRLQTWLAHTGRLKDWYQWLRIYEKMQAQGIAFVADAYVQENLPTTDMLHIFRKGFWKSCIQYIFSCHPELELFNGTLFETVIARYRDLSREFENLTRRELYARLASNIPYFTQEASKNSEVGILQKNIRNGARGISIRRLFDMVPTLLERLSPCMLMSPISVAQYIDPDAEPFDLIIFDEASQMPTYEAVGAMARGKHVVIVGDPKQMPPTSFFMVNTVDEDNIEMEDLESILDDCLSLSMPSKHLLWHYRSRHESLIAFSNAEYYDNKLLTFPSPDNLRSKVSVVPVDGFYDKGKSRQNRKEAQAVVREIIRRLSDDELRKKSIGVVTFSSVQQILIEDLLSEVLEKSPQLEQYAYESVEPVFIKNLENVQGDERDIILFSVGYGPDANGRVSMNFGPLNRAGGERRLNVAVSRARYEMIIFSTLRSDMIDLNRTSAVGVAGLKRFLEYAEKGVATHSRTTGITDDNISIGELIAAGIRRLGYTVHTNIGCSGYKIDVAIVNEESPSGYLLGILCDGENYRNTKTARDREIVQNNVLRQLGWNIYRVWTLDWFENRDAVLGGIMKAVEEVRENRKTERTHIPETTFTTVPVKPVLSFEEEVIVEEEPVQKESTYKPVVLKMSVENREDFYHANNREQILLQIKDVVKAEAPVTRSVIAKRIMQAWEINRQTQRFDSYLDEIINEANFYTITHSEFSFFWKDEEQYRNYSEYRVDSLREPGELPPEEIANGVRDILQQQISMPMPDLVRAAGQLFGFPRSGPNIDAAMFRGIQEATRKGYVKFNGGKIAIK